ncbi:hypothetical protein ACFE04_022473 [Oxalis oulophora]
MEGFQSRKQKLLICFLVVCLLQTRYGSVVALNYTSSYNYNKKVSSLRLERIQSHLHKINKPPVLTIHSPDGDMIDCIHKREQVALDHPLLKNHKIQREAPEFPKVKSSSSMNNNKIRRDNDAWQMWHINGTRCPKGTIPIRRSSLHDVLRAKSLFHFGKKQRHQSRQRSDAPQVLPGNGHEIWILSGSFDGSDLNSIEAGWQVSPELYGDSRPRLFTYWTTDSYQATGCYNLLCSGFVQTNSKIAIGAAISPVSSYNHNQYDITILVWKDPKLGNWWMSFGDNTLVGYWPAELFTHLADHATMVEWGGEVVNSRANGQHTYTEMGSGHFADEGFGKASYFRNLEIVDVDNSLSSIQGMSTLAENTNCYNIKSSYDEEWGTHFYYGGPGNNPLCP